MGKNKSQLIISVRIFNNNREKEKKKFNSKGEQPLRMTKKIAKNTGIKYL